PLFEANFDDPPPKGPHQAPSLASPLVAQSGGQAAALGVGAGVSSAAVGRGISPFAGSGSGNRPLVPAQAAPATAMRQPSGAPSISVEKLSASALAAGYRAPGGGTNPNASGEAGRLQPPAAMDVSVFLAPASNAPLGEVVGAKPSGSAGLPLNSSEGYGAGGASRTTTRFAGPPGASFAAKPSDASPQNDAGAAGTPANTAAVARGSSPSGVAGDPAAAPANIASAVSAAVSEDLAYVHRGPVLQSYAITGSVLVAASYGSRPRLRITDRKGHIATATANTAVAEENSAGSIPPTREYLCKAGGVQQGGGAAPKFLPTLMYRCSPAVKVLPVRVSCRLRPAGKSVVGVWAQVIVNPQIAQPLSGVSVLVNLPFSPRRGDKDDVKAEPPATLKADGKILEWVLPSGMKRGGKQIMQARLSVDEEEVRVAAIPQTAPAMVRCHLPDYMFSSVEIDAAALAGEGAEAAPGRVIKRCRVQCTQQG
ncbi:unnamed protein product, partial [Hapterophycus canaliculatus]